MTSQIQSDNSSEIQLRSRAKTTQGNFLHTVVTLEISECYISHLTQDLEFIFRVSLKELKKAYGILLESVAMPL